MNAWSLNKHDSIKLLVLLLQQRLGADMLALSPYQGLGSRAIRLASAEDPRITAYLFSYGQTDGRYGVHLEYPQAGGPDLGNSLDVFENQAIDAVVDMLQVHFGVPGETRHVGVAV